MEAYQASFFMTKKRHFDKPSLTVEKQIILLESRGIQIKNRELAENYLKFIGYYRLSGYTHYFKTENDRYRDGITFEVILEHYIFDRKLRILLFDVIERIEVALKSTITSVMAERYGAFWFTKSDIFVDRIGKKSIDGASSILQDIRKATIEQKHKDTFLKHYYDTYASPELPPSWIVMEALSMGVVSRILSLLRVEERKAIAEVFRMKERHLFSWMRSLTYVRNLCAHHARLWNRTFILKAEADKQYAICREKAFHQGKLYSQAVVIAILLGIIAPDNQWEQHIKELLTSFPRVCMEDMGFPENWHHFDLR